MSISTWFTTLSLVFGGCCSNAITLETLTTNYKGAGTLITFLQFLVITLYSLPSHLRWTRWGPVLAPRQIPLGPYIVQVLLFYVLSLLNNWAFKYSVPMSVHIIFRSGGLVVSLFLGWLIAGKRYSFGQVLSVLVVTAGVLLTTFSVDTSKKLSGSQWNFADYWQGIFLLFTALILGGLLGLVQDYTYSNLHKWQKPQTSGPGQGKAQASGPPPSQNKSSPPWRESLFYLHFLGLPLFWFVRNEIVDQIKFMNATSDKIPLTLPLPASLSPPEILPPHTIPGSFNTSVDLLSDFIVFSQNTLTFNVPSPVIPLLINTLTQLVCVAGVNRLTTQVSSLSVTMVLVLRKAVSLVISVIDFGFVPVIGSWLSTNHSSNKTRNVNMLMLWSGAFFRVSWEYILFHRNREEEEAATS